MKSINLTKLDKSSISFSSNEGREFLKNLATINVLVTQNCNLKCSYCFEKHKNKNKFDIDTLYKVFQFIKNVDNGRQRTINFFGGEPLLEKELILNFLKQYKEEIENTKSVDISLITNATLLTTDFIDNFLGYSFSKLIISFDTDKPELDNRKLGKEAIKSILEKIKYIIENYGPERLYIATSVSSKQIDYFDEFTKKLVLEYGVKNFYITPIIPLEEDWTDKKIKQLEYSLRWLLTNDIEVQFLESSGMKYTSNCMLRIWFFFCRQYWRFWWLLFFCK